MERKIGETFEYEGHKLKVIDNSNNNCDNCFFYNRDCSSIKDVIGFCSKGYRTDKKYVIFMKSEESENQLKNETEELKERKIGEVFEFEGKTLKAIESKHYTCYDCFFNSGNCSKYNAGYCEPKNRTDKKNIIFVEVEQPQKLNLCEILKDCPKGETFWSPLFGDVKLFEVNKHTNTVVVTAANLTTWRINHDATITISGSSSPEIMLYPSREQRDWSKFTPKFKKEIFNPNTFKPFDKVLVRDNNTDNWKCDLFSYIEESDVYKYVSIKSVFKQCIPYNDDTKYLVGTNKEAPEFYKYWED